jgi:hypothetical protein
MFTIQDLIRLLGMENNIVKRQTEGLTQADTLIQPQPSGNCMNWVLGHLMVNQVIMLQALGVESPVSEAELAPYRTESAPITAEGPSVLLLEDLLAKLDQVHQRLIARLGEMNDADFTKEVQQGERTVTLGWQIFFRFFHNSYHLGQLELLRQMAGRSEKLI